MNCDNIFSKLPRNLKPYGKVELTYSVQTDTTWRKIVDDFGLEVIGGGTHNNNCGIIAALAAIFVKKGLNKSALTSSFCNQKFSAAGKDYLKWLKNDIFEVGETSTNYNEHIAKWVGDVFKISTIIISDNFIEVNRVSANFIVIVQQGGHFVPVVNADNAKILELLRFIKANNDKAIEEAYSKCSAISFVEFCKEPLTDNQPLFIKKRYINDLLTYDRRCHSYILKALSVDGYLKAAYDSVRRLGDQDHESVARRLKYIEAYLKYLGNEVKLRGD